ncbi:kinase-like domain-containing protein [Rhizophagus irregularis DAOM 181602=DAOM 197198]|nr:kinase-like domain-containing protein [Rhizophagus irregularis DAOM 181602=DAOM 197198]
MRRSIRKLKNRCIKCGGMYTYEQYKWFQLRINDPNDIMFEWVPYDQFKIKEVGKDGPATVYLAKWKDGPLRWDKKKYIRDSDKTVVLKCLNVSHNVNLSDEDVEYSVKWYIDLKIFGISQKPDTKDYLMVLSNKYFEEYFKGYCVKCGEMYKNTQHKWSVWKDGQLKYDTNAKKYQRNGNGRVTLKSSQNTLDELLNEVKDYSINIYSNALNIYGISQNPNTKEYIIVLQNKYFEKYCESCGKTYSRMHKWCRTCQLGYLKRYFTCGDGKIDELIQDMQSRISNPKDIIFELIPYDQFDDVERDPIGYSAIWKDGPLVYNSDTRRYSRLPNGKFALKLLDGSKDMISEFIIKVKEYSINISSNILKIYGISIHPDTGDYLLNCVSGVDEKIDNFIQEMQLKVNNPKDLLFEWVSPDQFYDLKEIGKGGFATVYSAKWEDGPLSYNAETKKYERIPDMSFALKCMDNSQDMIDVFLNKVKDYSIDYLDNKIKIYGISQNPDTNDYMMVLGDHYGKDGYTTVYSAVWKSGPLCYNLHDKREYARDSNKSVALKYLNDSEQLVNNLFDKVKKYSIKIDGDCIIHGISQHVTTKEYIIVLENKYCDRYCKICGNVYIDIDYGWCKECKVINYTNWNGNEKVDNLIRDIRSEAVEYFDEVKISEVFEWIPYNNFDDIREIGKGGFASVYSAIWKDGPLFHKRKKDKLSRAPDKKVALKCLCNSQFLTDEFLNKVKRYAINSVDNSGKILKVYGLTQNPNTKEYVLVLQYAEGNVLVKGVYWVFSNDNITISDVGLYGDAGNTDETKIYGVMPYVAPEVLRGKSHIQQSDIYSFDICKGVRPESNEPEIPKCYIDLMKKCWISNPMKRPNVTEIEELIRLFYNSYKTKSDDDEIDNEIEDQFTEAETYRKSNKFIQSNIHHQAIYMSRLLNSHVKDLNKHLNDE